MTTDITAAAGTVQVKLGAGQVYDIVGVSAGTSYAFVLKDGPDVNGNFRTIVGGGAAVPVVAGQHLMTDSRPIAFTNGIAVTVSGTPGEFLIHWD
ncbi:MAG TPA: hypothetical protein VF749_17285 [Candidatus Acidoferrum sp.]